MTIRSEKAKTGPVNFKLQAAGAVILAASLVASSAYAAGQAPAPPAKKHVATHKAKTPPPPSVEDQINALRQEMQSQIDALKSSLADKDAQLRQAQQTATDAQAKADKAEADAMAQQQAQQQLTQQNAAAVATLQSTVNDLHTNTVDLVGTIQDVEKKSVKKGELSDLAFGKVKIGATFYADWSYWSDWDGSTSFVDNQETPSSTADQNYNTFEITRAYINLYYTPNDAATLRITPDIYRSADNSLAYRLKYAYADLNKLFVKSPAFAHDKITFGQMQSPLVPWEEDLNGHRYTYKVPEDFSEGVSSSYAGVKAHGPIEVGGKAYLDYDLGVFTNGSYKTTELSANKQFMGRVTYYPFGTKVNLTGLGVTVFGDYGTTNVAPSSAASGQYEIDKSVYMVHYQTTNKAYLITGQYNMSHNSTALGANQQGFAFEGNARLGNRKSHFQAWGLYQYFEPYTNTSKDQATRYSRTVGGIAYKVDNHLDIALGDSNLHYMNATAAGKDDDNAVSIFTQYIF